MSDAGQRLLWALKWQAAIAAIACYASISFGKTDVPVFLFSGQSNMVCLGSAVSGLSADQKKPLENIKIDCVSDNNIKKWTTLGPGFGADANHFGPELLFGKTLSDSMPDKKIAFIKNAKSGTYLGQTGGWLPPSSNNGTGGTLYRNMMTQIDNALKTFNNAFDTAQYTPRWAGFVWLQGEFDGMQQNLANKYETNLTNLIKDIRAKTEVEDLPVILEMIKPTSMWQYAATIRAANIACTQKLKNVDTMDTKNLALSSDNVHYNAASMIIIGTVSAQRWLNMHYNYGGTVPVAFRLVQRSSPRQMSLAQFSTGMLVDLAGRKIRNANGTFESPLSHGCVLIATINRDGALQGFKRMTVEK